MFTVAYTCKLYEREIFRSIKLKWDPCLLFSKKHVFLNELQNFGVNEVLKGEK